MQDLCRMCGLWITSPSAGLFFILLTRSFAEQTRSLLVKPNLPNFLLMSHTLGARCENSRLALDPEVFLVFVISPKSFMSYI